MEIKDAKTFVSECAPSSLKAILVASCHTSIQESTNPTSLGVPVTVDMFASTGSVIVTGTSTKGVVLSKLIVTSSENDGRAIRVVKTTIAIIAENLRNNLNR